jgi:uncharacterized protein (DUF1697 family)
MDTYIAFLRGVNVGGNNTVPMPQLKALFEQQGLTDVSTYINSGNVIFQADGPEYVLKQKCEQMIMNRFGFAVTVMVISAAALVDAIAHAPAWWGASPDATHNALFVIPPATPESIMAQVGAAKPEYEQVASHGPVIFWSAPVKTWSRTRYSKIVGTKAYGDITIRNANTARKLSELSDGRR